MYNTGIFTLYYLFYKYNNLNLLKKNYFYNFNLNKLFFNIYYISYTLIYFAYLIEH